MVPIKPARIEAGSHHTMYNRINQKFQVTKAMMIGNSQTANINMMATSHMKSFFPIIKNYYIQH